MAEQKMEVVDIARDNDRFRVLGDGKGRVLISEGVAGVRHAHRIINAMRSFNSFQVKSSNREHRFGAFEVAGEKCCFVLDYFADASCQQSADPRQGPVYRVLRVMLASEYKHNGGLSGESHERGRSAGGP